MCVCVWAWSDRRNSLIQQFEALEQLRPSLAGLSLPLDLVQYARCLSGNGGRCEALIILGIVCGVGRHVDQGLNPDLYAHSFLEQCQKATEVARGKRVALEQLASSIEKELAQAPPPL